MTNPFSLVLPLILALANMFPLNQELKSQLQGGDHDIETIVKVTKNKDTYTYLYCIKNNSGNKVRVKWETLNRALYFGHDVELLWEIEPNENINVVLEHPDPPIQVTGRIQCFPLTNKKAFERMVKATPEIPKKVKIDVPEAKFFRSVSGNSAGAIPVSYLGK